MARWQAVRNILIAAVAVTLLVATVPVAGAPATFVPNRPIEWTIPAGTGGGADQQARFMAPLIAKYNLSPQPFIPVNRSAGAGAQAFQYMIDKAGESNQILITLDSLFFTPLNQEIKMPDGTRFDWRDMTPIARLLLDNFILWVHADSPYKTLGDFEKAVKAAPAGAFKMAGTGSRQEDEIIMVLLEQTWGVKFAYVPFAGGGAVAAALVGKQVDFTVNNPIEAIGQWEGGRLRPLAIFASRRVQAKPWDQVPTMKELGTNIEYQMLRGIFGPPNMPTAAAAWYVTLFRQLLDTPDMAQFIQTGGFDRAFLTGTDFVRWLEQKDANVKALMVKAGWIK
ncbi:MAG TPA: tripartite tricarboxylate transporter substrate binding protein [bacterium]|jgi:putative tricarboxylic transport membrane protein